MASKKVKPVVFVLAALSVVIWLAVTFVQRPDTAENTSEYKIDASLAQHQNPAKSTGEYKKRACRELNSTLDWKPPATPDHIQRLPQTSTELANYISECWLLPPFTTPRNLRNEKQLHYSQAAQSQFIDDLLKQRTDGFFIECGAFSGETHSNSLFFEKSRNWKGLLIEANPDSFKELLKKSRHSYMMNACLSPKQSPSVLSFRVAGEIGGLVDVMEAKHKKRVDHEFGTATPVIQMQCFPLISILKALGITHVDYFSLDIEGAELGVLQTIPFDEIQIDVLSIEYVISNDPQGTKQKLEKIKDLLVKKHGYEIVRLDKHLDVILHKK